MNAWGNASGNASNFLMLKWITQKIMEKSLNAQNIPILWPIVAKVSWYSASVFIFHLWILLLKTIKFKTGRLWVKNYTFYLSRRLQRSIKCWLSWGRKQRRTFCTKHHSIWWRYVTKVFLGGEIIYEFPEFRISSQFFCFSFQLMMYPKAEKTMDLLIQNKTTERYEMLIQKDKQWWNQ